ncbi:unnamed protein product [Periconia digitata]|uniref:Uncharacterized protein n=1 Tax=Periconia digitata TaxID=1303443 RepID=A0A9W4UEL8_9PLEO|nr:unnamed protein product [Periconia digitata]
MLSLRRPTTCNQPPHTNSPSSPSPSLLDVTTSLFAPSVSSTVSTMSPIMYSDFLCPIVPSQRQPKTTRNAPWNIAITKAGNRRPSKVPRGGIINYGSALDAKMSISTVLRPIERDLLVKFTSGFESALNLD